MFDENQTYKHANELISVLRQKAIAKGKEITIMAAGSAYAEIEEESSIEEKIKHLKDKVDAGVDVIITQVLYSAENFIEFLARCREYGISSAVPIIPGCYIPRTFDELNLMQKITNVYLPEQLYFDLEESRDDEEKFQKIGLSFMVKMIKQIQRASPEFIRGYHFFTFSSKLTMIQKLIKLVSFSEE